MEYFAGLDISMDETHVCVVDREEGGREALEAAGITLHALFQRHEFSAPGTRA